MLTRLKVDGFKNLVGVDIHFGPFTCVAGVNGVGKSNLFDAIRFLKAVASKPLAEAAALIRDEEGRSDVRGIFHRAGTTQSRKITFEVEMIVPPESVDELGQIAKAKSTFLRYKLSVGLRNDGEALRSLGPLEILEEELNHIKVREALQRLRFPHSKSWMQSVIRGARNVPFISTEQDDPTLIKLHQDGEGGGRARSLLAQNLPRTVLSSANAAESPTAVCARREMESWTLLQLESSAMRRPDDDNSPNTLGPDGAHLAATLYRLSGTDRAQNSEDAQKNSAAIYSKLANRLRALIDDVSTVCVDHDQKRQLLTLQVGGKDHTMHPARSLSDGTLRFLALAVLELDPLSQGLVCLEEPENGIHPARIPGMLRLLLEIACDTECEVDQSNPLRQVIINTHSPSVVAQVPDDSLLQATKKERVLDGAPFHTVEFCALAKTWRSEIVPPPEFVSLGELMSYLNPIQFSKNAILEDNNSGGTIRVADRKDIQLLLGLDV